MGGFTADGKEKMGFTTELEEKFAGKEISSQKIKKGYQVKRL